MLHQVAEGAIFGGGQFFRGDRDLEFDLRRVEPFKRCRGQFLVVLSQK
jgi:hypothetical protein